MPQAPKRPRRFKTGAKRSPAHKLLAAVPHIVIKAPPPQFAVVPTKLSMWDNDQDGDCVTAEEAYAKACWSIMCGLPELFVPDAEVIRWATKYDFLNGATLTDVMDKMALDGFQVGGLAYTDGSYSSVDYSNETNLQSAISQGPVKIAIDANALPEGAGNGNGWEATGRGDFPDTDHCVSLSGYGPAGWLYQQLGVKLPAALSADQRGYLLFTWSSIGFVDHDWLMGTCVESWLRTPTTPQQSPTPPPGPPTPPPPPPPPPPPTIQQFLDQLIQGLESAVAAFPPLVAALQQLQAWIDGFFAAIPAAGARSMRRGDSILKTLIDSLFTSLNQAAISFPLLGLALRMIEGVVDQWLVNNGYGRLHASSSGIAAA